jgi:hypothetical protein
MIFRGSTERRENEAILRNLEPSMLDDLWRVGIRDDVVYNRNASRTMDGTICEK